MARRSVYNLDRIAIFKFIAANLRDPSGETEMPNVSASAPPDSIERTGGGDWLVRLVFSFERTPNDIHIARLPIAERDADAAVVSSRRAPSAHAQIY
jgi:hypothetical protein